MLVPPFYNQKRSLPTGYDIEGLPLKLWPGKYKNVYRVKASKERYSKI